MNRFVVVLLFCVTQSSMGFLRAQDDENKPVNLLRLASVKTERSTAFAIEQAGLATLTDDDASTVAVIKATGGTVDIVYGFDGAMVTPERLEVQLPENTVPESATERVEILVSTVSMQAGFQSLRADPLKPTGQPQVFAFTPAAARWIMLRFTAVENAENVAVAEIRLFGHEGPPVSRYAFNESPAQAFDVLERLKKTSAVNVGITEDEAALFADVKDGKFNKWSFGEAALIVSGITDANERNEYVKRLDALETQARAAVAGATTPFEKGEKLLAWMHAADGPLAKGYSARQTDLSVILDTGTFNCVSSATLYNVLGRRLGLDVRAIEVPDHAFSILYDGTKHADVETTTASGFDPARDPAAQENIMEKTGFRYIPDSNRDQRREIAEAGLVAIIYYNHGVTLSDEKRHHEALLAYFRAMALDREFSSAVKNALAALASWSSGLADEGKFEAARNVLVAGLDLAPKDATFLHNRKVVWGQWADAAALSNRDDEAVDILRRAAAEVPDGNFPAMQAWIYIRRGEELVKAGEWEMALAAAEPGFQKIDEAPQKELKEWTANLPLRWSQSEMEAKNYAKAIDLLDDARSRQPDDERLTQNIVFAMQEWVRETFEKEGEARARELLAGQLKRFPQFTGLNDVAASHVQRVVSQLRDEGKYEESLAAVERHKEFLKEKDAAKNLNQSIFDAWANSFTAAKNHEQAVVVYEQGLKQFPADEHLMQNLVYTMQEWIKEAFAAEGEANARTVLLGLKKRFPEMVEVDELAIAHAQRVVASLRDAGKYEESLASVDRHKEFFTKEGAAQNLNQSIFDAWANSFIAEKNPEQAVVVYQRGLKQFPGDEHLKQNLVYTMQEWIKEAAAAGGAAKAKTVLLGLQKRFPGMADVDELAMAHVQRVVAGLRDEAKFTEALDAITTHKSLLKGKDDARALGLTVYDAWANGFREKREWQAAIDIYTKGLEQYPADSHLSNNAVAIWNTWASTFIDKKDWAAAIKVYEKALLQFPKSGTLENNQNYCKEQLKK